MVDRGQRWTKPRHVFGVVGVLAALAVLPACGRDGDGEVGVGGETTLRITTTSAVSQTVATTTTTIQLTYVIQSGDSLSVIAERFGVSTQELADFNAIADVNAIKVGQELSIPPTTAAPATTASTEAASTTAAG